LAAKTADEWASHLSAAGVPAGKVGTIADGFALAEMLGLRPLVEVGGGLPAQVRNPVAFSDTPITNYAPPPRLGQHSDDVRRWLSEEETP
jgi:formyl-CoA transferase